MGNIVFEVDIPDRLKTETPIEILQMRLRRKINLALRPCLLYTSDAADEQCMV